LSLVLFDVDPLLFNLLKLKVILLTDNLVLLLKSRPELGMVLDLLASLEHLTV
jgi:hypothetical protein